MKYLLIIVYVSFSMSTKAQDIASFGKAPGSEIKLYHPANDKQSGLESTTALKSQKKKLGGFGGVSFSYELKGEKSDVRINADSAIFILVQGTGMMGMDISMSIMLYKLEVRGGNRIAVVGDYKPSVLGMGKTTDTKINTNSKQLKEGLTQILPEKKLEKGEYAFITGLMEGNNYDGKNTKYIVYAFSIE
jgi:1-aminocyclopropane-1-carboxylate deaminase/D-cysteine desulfhydrase-like pyridoxal-dependent ACC family enzyme